MRLAYVLTRADDLGGAQIHVRDLASEMVRAGHSVTVFAGAPGVLSEQLAERGVPFVEVPGLGRALHPLRDLAAHARLKSALRAFAPDLISCHSSKAGVLGRLAARSLRTQVVFTAHGWAFTEGVPRVRRRLYEWIERGAARLGGRIIAVSRHDRASALRAGIAREAEIRVVHNGMPDVGPELLARPECSPPRIVTIARFGEQKDHPTLLRALARLSDLDWHLDVIGAGPGRDDIEQLARELGIGDRVAFLGLVRDVRPVLARAQAFALITHWEGFPRSILEAMRAGLPVVASAVGGVPESVEDDATGALVPRSDVSTLVDRLRKLLESPGLRAAQGREGRRRYEAEFTFDHMFAHTLAVYRDALAAHAGREGR